MRFGPCASFHAWSVGQLRPQPLVRRPCVARHHHASADVADEFRDRRSGSGGRHADREPRQDRGFRMAHPGGHPEKNRNPPALADLERRAQQIVRILRIRRLEHRRRRGLGIAPAVLFILARRHAGIVGHHQNVTAVHARIGHGEENIGRHVEADVLHRANHPRTGERCAQRHFCGHFLIWRPLGFPAEGAEFLEDLRGRRARIARSESHAAMQRRQRHRLVAAQKQPAGRVLGGLHGRSSGWLVVSRGWRIALPLEERYRAKRHPHLLAMRRRTACPATCSVP